MRTGLVAAVGALALAGGLALVGVSVAAGDDAPVAAPVPPVATPVPPVTAPGPAPHLSTEKPDDKLPVRRLRAAAVDPAAVPVRLTIPSIGVSSSLVRLGIAGDGTLEVPTDFQRAGWLRAGPAPGERGPAVIAGHVDSKAGPAVFARLGELRPGAEVDVRRADGRTVRFTVDGSEQVAKKRFPTDDVYGPVPGPVLRLITCGGSFDPASGHYRDNIVVFASVHG